MIQKVLLFFGAYHIDYVHCNLGWGGSCNGYYKSEIFNTNEGAVDLPKSSSTSGTEYDYEYNLKIVPNIRPNK